MACSPNQGHFQLHHFQPSSGVTKIPVLRTNASRKKLTLLAGLQLPPFPSKLVTGNLRGIKKEARIRLTPEENICDYCSHLVCSENSVQSLSCV